MHPTQGHHTEQTQLLARMSFFHSLDPGSGYLIMLEPKKMGMGLVE